MAKKRQSYFERRQKIESVNKKAIMWTAGSAVFFILVIVLLLIMSK